MYPFYQADKTAGRITDDEVLELLEYLRIKDMQLNRISGERNRKKNAGLAKWHNWTIGGVTSDGRDATNELTSLLQHYRDLVVRVAGYSAYFVQLNSAMQNEVVARTELSLAGM